MAPTPRKTTLRSSELKREAILEAALDLFVERGYHGTAVPLVAEKAHVGAGTIYRYFSNKEALVNALYQKHKRAVAQHVLDGFPMQAPARAQFHAFWTRLADFAQTRQKAFAFLEFHSHADYVNDDSRAVEKQLTDIGLSFIEATQAKNEIKPLEPMMLISIVFGAFIGLMRVAWDGKLALTPETIEAAEQCCWEAIRA